MRLKDRVAIITGAARGIGAAFAVGFAKEGAKVVIADVLDGQKAVKAVEDAGGEAIFVKTDVASQADCDALAKAAFDRFGSIDILVNNAAYFASVVQRPFIEIDDEEWNKVMAVNIGGCFHCTKAVFPYMKDKGGKIINISSSTIFEGVPGFPHYVSSKGAVVAFSRCMARELGQNNIRVNTIAPGFTHSEGAEQFDSLKKFEAISSEDILMPQRCIKKVPVPEDLVGAAVFLASDDSDSMTGQLLLCDLGVNFN